MIIIKPISQEMSFNKGEDLIKSVYLYSPYEIKIRIVNIKKAGLYPTLQ